VVHFEKWLLSCSVLFRVFRVFGGSFDTINHGIDGKHREHRIRKADDRTAFNRREMFRKG
jgi:hypothetical protein